MSHLEVPGDEVQLLIWTQLICHGAGPSDEDDTIVMKTDSIDHFRFDVDQEDKMGTSL